MVPGPWPVRGSWTQDKGRRTDRRRTKAPRTKSQGPDLADVAQLAERVLGKDEVTSSILVIGSSSFSPRREPWPRARSGRGELGRLAAAQSDARRDNDVSRTLRT